MTDCEKLIALLESFGVHPHQSNHLDVVEISVESGDDLVEGYSGFNCVFVFDLSGKFVKIGVWE